MKPNKKLPNTVKTRNQIFESIETSPKASNKMKYFDKIPKTMFQTPPRYLIPILKTAPLESLSIISNLESSRERITTSQTFSKLSRFENSIFEKFNSIFYTDRIFRVPNLAQTDKEAQEKRFSSNKDMSRHTPQGKRSIITAFNELYETKKLLTKKTKTQILMETKQQRIKSLEEKFRRLEIRQKLNVFYMQECAAIKKSWITLNCILGLAFKIKFKLKYKKKLKAKNFRRMKKLRVYVKCISKFLIIYWTQKTYRASIFIRLNFMHKVRQWRVLKRKSMMNVLVSTSEGILTKSVMFSLMVKWKFTVFRI